MERVIPQKPDLDIRRRDDGTFAYGVGGKFGCIGRGIPLEVAALCEPAILHSSVTPPRRKIDAAKWYLSNLQICVLNEAASLLFLEGFLSELRSSTFALQKLFRHVAGFDAWYGTQQANMKDDRLLCWLNKARTVAQKEGVAFASWAPQIILRFYRNGKIDAEHKEPSFGVSGEYHTMQELEAMIATVDAIVEEAHSLFFDDSQVKKHTLRFETAREREDGTWEHFDLPRPPKINLFQKQGRE